MSRTTQGISDRQGAAGGVLDAIEREVQSREAQGAVRTTLGSCEMPDGYALMRDLADGTFFWLRADGAESPRHYSRWEVWELARADSEKPVRWIGDVIQEFFESVPDEEFEKVPVTLSSSVDELKRRQAIRSKLIGRPASSKEYWQGRQAAESDFAWCEAMYRLGKHEYQCADCDYLAGTDRYRNWHEGYADYFIDHDSHVLLPGFHSTNKGQSILTKADSNEH